MTRLDYTRWLKNFLLNKTGIPRPFNAQIELTMHCNFRCEFCGIPYNQDFYAGQEMTLAQIKRVVDDLDACDITTLSLTGGEPLIRPDVGEIVKYATDKGTFIVAIATNGWFLEKRLKTGLMDGLEFLLVSLDSVDPKKHDRGRGKAGAWERAVAGIREARRRDVKVIIHNLITTENVDEMEQMAQLAGDLNCMVEFLPCEDIVRETEKGSYKVEDEYIQRFIPNLQLYAARALDLMERYKNVTSDPVTVKVIRDGGFGRKLVDKNRYVYRQRHLRCHVASAYIFVRYDGSVNWPCKFHPVLSRSILKFPIQRLYNTEEVRKIQKMKDGFPFCNGCRLGCGIAASLPVEWNGVYSKYIRAFLRGNLWDDKGH
ncbi:MAG: radical SAM protein [Promethearchaeota archaeon]